MTTARHTPPWGKEPAVSTIRELLTALRDHGVARAVVSRHMPWDFVVAVPPHEVDLMARRLALLAGRWPLAMRVRAAAMTGKELATVWDVRFSGDTGAPRIVPTTGPEGANGKI